MRYMRLCGVIATLFVSLSVIGLWAADSGASNYRLIKTYKFGAAPGGKEYFDYITVDSPARRVYLSHGTEVLVMNADTGALEGEIPGFVQEHGVAIATDFGRGFITDGGAAKVIIFDLKTLKKVGEVKADIDADCIIYDPESKRVFSMNGDSGTSTAIDAKEGKVVGTIPLGGKLEFAASDGAGTIYVNLTDKNQVVAFDSRTLQVKSRWPMKSGGTPVAMAIDPIHRRLFVAGRSPQKLLVMNADDGKVLQDLPIAAGVDAAVYDPKDARVFVSTRAGVIHIFHEESADKLIEVGQVKTEFGAKTMAYDSKTQDLITDTADFGPASAQGRRAAIPGTFRVLIYGK